MYISMQCRNQTIAINAFAPNTDSISVATIKSCASLQLYEPPENGKPEIDMPVDTIFIVLNKKILPDDTTLSKSELRESASENQTIFLCYLTEEERQQGLILDFESENPSLPKATKEALNLRNTSTSMTLFPCIKDKKQSNIAAAHIIGSTLLALGTGLAALSGLITPFVAAILCLTIVAATLTATGITMTCYPSEEHAPASASLK